MARRLRAGHWIEEWDPEDDGFWQRTGCRVAHRNLLFSVVAEHIGFSVWTLWSVMVLFMGPEYGIDAAGKFFLVAVPTLVGAVLRLPYTFAVAMFGGRNWTIDSGDLPGQGARGDRKRRRPDHAADAGATLVRRGDRHQVGALGGLFINLAFRQSFLTAKTGDPAFWTFIAFYLACIVVTYLVYLRPAPDRAHPRAAYARV